MVELTALATTTPVHRVDAAATKAALSSWLGGDAQRYCHMVDRARIHARYTVEPIESLLRLQTPDARNAAYARHATALAETVTRTALQAAGIDPTSIDAIIAVSCTGHMMPSLDAYLVNRLGLNPVARRIPIMQLGCAAGVGAVGLAAQLQQHACGSNVLVVSVEICSLCLQVSEPSPADVMGSLLFGDGAAAVVMSGSGHGCGPQVVASRGVLWPDSVDVLQMRFTSTGPRFVLARDLPNRFRVHLRAAAEAFLRAQGLARSDVRFYVIHPGGPKVLNAVAESLQLSDAAVQPSWRVWERYGNLSSATVFFILEELDLSVRPNDGELGLMLAVGPGLTCEMALLCWRGHLRGAR